MQQNDEHFEMIPVSSSEDQELFQQPVIIREQQPIFSLSLATNKLKVAIASQKGFLLKLDEGPVFQYKQVYEIGSVSGVFSGKLVYIVQDSNLLAMTNFKNPEIVYFYDGNRLRQIYSHDFYVPVQALSGLDMTLFVKIPEKLLFFNMKTKTVIRFIDCQSFNVNRMLKSVILQCNKQIAVLTKICQKKFTLQKKPQHICTGNIHFLIINDLQFTVYSTFNMQKQGQLYRGFKQKRIQAASFLQQNLLGLISQNDFAFTLHLYKISDIQKTSALSSYKKIKFSSWKDPEAVHFNTIIRKVDKNIQIFSPYRFFLEFQIPENEVTVINNSEKRTWLT